MVPNRATHHGRNGIPHNGTHNGIPARILKETSNEITEAMALLLKASLTQSDIPGTWKEALISPLFKGGKKDRNKAKNFRPVSVMSISCKVLGHILHIVI